MKILVIGNINAGKTSLCRRFASDEFTDGYKATVGVDIHRKGDVFLWDVAGQERFGNITSVYYRGASAALVVFDWNAPDSLETAVRWVVDVEIKCDPPVPILLIANKIDLPSCYSLEDIESLCKGNENIIGWEPVSAKTGEGVTGAITRLQSVAIAKRQEDDVLKLMGELEEQDNACCI